LIEPNISQHYLYRKRIFESRKQMDIETIERLTNQLNQLQIEVNQIQRELLEARQGNNQNPNQRNPRNARVDNNCPFQVGDRVLIMNKLRLLEISYLKLTISRDISRFSTDYVILSLLVTETVGDYREVRRASHNLKHVQVVQQ